MDRIERRLSEVDEADFELLDPPAAVWQGIDLTLGSEAARRPPGGHGSVPLVVEYRIDADDVLVEVGSGWAEFADANDAPALASPEPGLVLWAAIDGDEIRSLWQLVVGRVRDRQRALSVPFRCDAPDTRRWFEMTISPEVDGSVRFRSVLSFEEARPSVALLDPRSGRDEAQRPVPLCSWCGRGELDSEWLDIEDLVRVGRLLEQTSLPPLAHGVCGGCRREMSSALADSASTS